jgi:hypothetical protein
MRGERVHHRDICDCDASPEDHEDVPTSLDVGSKAVRCGAGTGCKDGQTANWRVEGGGNSGPLHSTRNIPFRISWRSVSCAARARHRMAWSVSE